MPIRISRSSNAKRAGPRRLGDSGFTLLEVLVSFSILALMGALTSSFLQQLSSIKRLETTTAQQMELDQATQFLSRLLEGVQPIQLLDAEPGSSVFMRGHPQSLKASSIMRQGVLSYGLKEVEIYVHDDAETPTLIFNATPRRMRNGEVVSVSQDTISIIKGIKHFRLEYADNGDWFDSFFQEGELPDAIRARIAIVADGALMETVAIANLR